MTATGWIVLIVGIIVIAAIVVLFRMRSTKLRTKFGPEYDRLVREHGSTVTAEREMERREKRVANFHIHPLTEQQCEHYVMAWRDTQAKFVDDPRGAVADADRLVNRAMKDRGYPVQGEFTERAADLSVEHPRVVEHYRVAHDIAEADSRQTASTEDLRLAMKHYRALFEDLLGRPVEELTGARR